MVIASNDHGAGDKLGELLNLGAPFRDPGVAEFGLENVVFALGHQFLEIVFPVSDEAPARRFIDRNGAGGYMAIFQTDDLEAARARIDRIGVRRVWDIDLPEITASHLHPADTGAAIVSIDEARPAESWRWGGPDWSNRKAGQHLTLIGAELVGPDPQDLAKRWAAVLEAPLSRDGEGWRLELAAGAAILVRPGRKEALSAFQIGCIAPEAIVAQARQLGYEGPGRDSFRFEGVRFDLVEGG